MQYNILFCTLAVGNEYNGYAQNLFKTIQKKTNSRLLVVTDNPSYFENMMDERLIIKKLDESFTLTSNLVDSIRNFNYNLKYVPISFANMETCDYIAYIDCDWLLKFNASLNKFESCITEMLHLDCDGIAGRGRLLIHEKTGRTFLPMEKIVFYGLDKTEKYDQCQLVNEQYLIFKKTDKLNRFIAFWAALEKKCTEEKGMAYAEGLEIGMAALDAGIKFHIRQTLGDVFIFYSNKQQTFYEV